VHRKIINGELWEKDPKVFLFVSIATSLTKSGKFFMTWVPPIKIA